MPFEKLNVTFVKKESFPPRQEFVVDGFVFEGFTKFISKKYYSSNYSRENLKFYSVKTPSVADKSCLEYNIKHRDVIVIDASIEKDNFIVWANTPTQKELLPFATVKKWLVDSNVKLVVVDDEKCAEFFADRDSSYLVLFLPFGYNFPDYLSDVFQSSNIRENLTQAIRKMVKDYLENPSNNDPYENDFLASPKIFPKI